MGIRYKTKIGLVKPKALEQMARVLAAMKLAAQHSVKENKEVPWHSFLFGDYYSRQKVGQPLAPLLVPRYLTKKEGVGKNPAYYFTPETAQRFLDEFDMLVEALLGQPIIIRIEVPDSVSAVLKVHGDGKPESSGAD